MNTIFDKMTYGHYIVTALKPGEELKTRTKDYIAAGTVNWVSQVSFEPRMFAVAIGMFSDLNETIDYSKHFSIHVLSEEQNEWVREFGKNSTIEDGKINGIPFQKKENNLLLPTSIGYFTCKLEKSFNNGDHTLHIGRVIDHHLNDVSAKPINTAELPMRYTPESAAI